MKGGALLHDPECLFCLTYFNGDEEDDIPTDPAVLTAEDIAHLRGVALLDGLLARKE